MCGIDIRPLISSDKRWLTDFLITHWGSAMMVSRGRLFDVSTHCGWVAENDQKEVMGLITYEHLVDESREITCLESRTETQGIGSRLLQAVIDQARAEKWPRLWLITTNDNLNALRFYQKRGFVLKALYPNALEISRCLKPEIPIIGLNNITIRDEIELEYLLT